MKQFTFAASLALCLQSAVPAHTITTFEAGLYAGGNTGGNEMQAGPAGFGIFQAHFNDYLSLAFQIGDIHNTSNHSTVLFTGPHDALSIELVPRLYIARPAEASGDVKPGFCRPYLQAGVGYYSLSPNRTRVAGLNSLDQNIDDSQIGGVFGGGLDYPVTPAITFGIDIAYIYLHSTAHTVAGVTPQDTQAFIDNGLNLDSLRVTAGVRYRFSFH